MDANDICVLHVGKYLSYERYGKTYPGRVRLQSAAAKRPMTWEVKNYAGNRVTLEAVGHWQYPILSILHHKKMIISWNINEIALFYVYSLKEQDVAPPSCRT